MIVRRCIQVPSLIATLCLFLSACTHAPETHNFTSAPVEMHRLFVLTELGAENNNPFASSFADSFSTNLQPCTIKTKIENVPVKDRSLSLDADPFVAVNVEMNSFAPDSILRITQGASTEISKTISGIKFNAMLIYKGKMAWRGTFSTGSELNATVGATLAHTITDKMHQDGVLTECNSPTGVSK